MAVERPRISRKMQEYRRTCGFHQVPSLGQEGFPDLWGREFDACRWIVYELFSDDPYRRVDESFRVHLRSTGWRISARRFKRAVEQLREAGLLDGDQLRADLLASWEKQWRRDMRKNNVMVKLDP